MCDWLDSEEFYDLMQQYRHAPIGNQAFVVVCFEEIKRRIRENMKREAA